MKAKTKFRQRERKFSAAKPLEAVPSKSKRSKSGTVQKQYPAKVGYHGTDNETDLNPEE